MAAKAKQKKLDKGATTVEVTLAVGNANLFAESPMTLIGFRAGTTVANGPPPRLNTIFQRLGLRLESKAKRAINSRNLQINLPPNIAQNHAKYLAALHILKCLIETTKHKKRTWLIT
ncbi:hypothetical protein [Methylomonas rapida]|uniref:Uncharacterized protein n=1 Tax=Methylomonas rapida TaxID=2963939 RepID=A0ABY7GCK0_9GAMM|nr:hypothetical protein [Methylomonas rapida]WAR43032.1 hypothetical protein NM686_011525 [Methylomonas rapida]